VCSTFVCLLLVQEFNLANLILSCFQQNKNLFCSIRSMYEYMINEGVPFNNKFIWKPKIPLKIKIFLWYLQRGVILTKDNLTKRTGLGVKSVVSVIVMKQSNISFLIVNMLNIFAELFR
jgi:hypothetical protein